VGVPNEVIEHVLELAVSILVQSGRQWGFFYALCSGSSLEKKHP
jgi:hypothetical protein